MSTFIQITKVAALVEAEAQAQAAFEYQRQQFGESYIDKPASLRRRRWGCSGPGPALEAERSERQKRWEAEAAASAVYGQPCKRRQHAQSIRSLSVSSYIQYQVSFGQACRVPVAPPCPLLA